jgi:hypothetical protein
MPQIHDMKAFLPLLKPFLGQQQQRAVLLFAVVKETIYMTEKSKLHASQPAYFTVHTHILFPVSIYELLRALGAAEPASKASQYGINACMQRS